MDRMSAGRTALPVFSPESCLDNLEHTKTAGAKLASKCPRPTTEQVLTVTVCCNDSDKRLGKLDVKNWRCTEKDTSRYCSCKVLWHKCFFNVLVKTVNVRPTQLGARSSGAPKVPRSTKIENTSEAFAKRHVLDSVEFG